MGTAFDPTFAIALGIALKQAETAGQNAAISDYTPPPGYTAIALITANDLASPLIEGVYQRASFGYLAQSAHNPNNILVVVRGTGTAAEWVQNIKFLRRPFWGQTQNGNVEDGFDDLTNSVKYTNPDGTSFSFLRPYQLTFAGHSLGSSIVTLLAMHWAIGYRDAAGVKVAGVYAFASPNVGDKLFADTYNRMVPNTFHIVIPQDIVPHLPPSLLGFQFVGQPVVLIPGADTKGGIEEYHDLNTYVALIRAQYRV